MIACRSIVVRCVRRETGKHADKDEEQRAPHVVIMPIDRDMRAIGLEVVRSDVPGSPF